MKVVGIIAEYNPFHNGHAYQIKRAKELSGADYVIVAMSGNYVQRGAPAIIDKFSRAAMALKNGADLVFELPVVWATASAEYFATAGVALFDHLGIVDNICFGCETPNTELLTETSRLLAFEPEEYSKILSLLLKEGLNYPSARDNAITRYLSEFSSGIKQQFSYDDILMLFAKPNNILGVEYEKALLRRNSKILPLPILRQGAGYHSNEFHDKYSSATALRRLLLDKCITSTEQNEILSKYVPKDTAALLTAPDTIFLEENDFSDMLYYKLLSERESGFADYADCSKFLSNRIANSLDSFFDYTDFCSLAKSRDVTHTRISRLLLHILLNIHTSDYDLGKSLDYIPYLRPLGFRKDATCLLTEIKKNTDCPLLTKPAKAASLLSPKAYALYQLDLFASNLYYGTVARKSRIFEKNEYQRELIISE